MDIPAVPRDQVQAMLRYKLPSLVDDALLEYADFLGRPVEAIREVYNAMVRADFQEELPEEMQFLPSLLSESRLPHVLMRLQVMLAFAPPLKGASFLDIGPGIGRDCLAFARCGAKVTHADVPCPAVEFARWRYRQRNLDVRIVDALHLPPEHFDVIGCHDVFEHVQDPAELLVHYVAHLAPGGMLFTSLDLFNPCTDHIAKNDFYASFYDPLLKDLGLEFGMGHSSPVHDASSARLRIYTRARPAFGSFEEEFAQIRAEGYAYAARELGRLRALLDAEHDRVSALSSTYTAVAAAA